jgi:FtsH-binding integral membrane protein
MMKLYPFQAEEYLLSLALICVGIFCALAISSLNLQSQNRGPVLLLVITLLALAVFWKNRPQKPLALGGHLAILWGAVVVLVMLVQPWVFGARSLNLAPLTLASAVVGPFLAGLLFSWFFRGKSPKS